MNTPTFQSPMSQLLSYLKKKPLIWFLLSIPLLWILSETLTYSVHNYKFWSRSLAISGYTALGCFVFCLSLTPLNKLFSTSQLLKVLNRHRREFGLSSFYYACIHFLSYLIKKVLKTGQFPWKFISHPIIITGLSAFCLLLVIAAISNDYSVRKLGWEKWKKIQSLAYLAQAAIFLHLVLQHETQIIWALLLFIPLLTLQMLRLRKKDQ
ncbi:MAG: ferric reductase-like transmembrane domain-containing protein [Verrucomicrobia bacterium]|nr:ferric reductase-like transmembrane domain-containing protein [Verrucomicrobiota bacterium]